LDDLDVLARRELPDEEGRADHEQREADQVVEHAVAHRVPEDRQRDPQQRPRIHASAPSRADVVFATWVTKISSSVVCSGCTAISAAPAPVMSVTNRATSASRASSNV